MHDSLDETLRLVQAAQAGERDALDRVLRRYYPRVRKILRLRMGAKLRRRMESSDLLQETFADALRDFDRFEMRSEASLIHWLAKLAERRLLHAAESQAALRRDVDREVEWPSAEEDMLPDLATGDSAIPLGAVIQREEGATIESCLQALPEHYRESIVLRNYVGLSFAQVAEETGRPSEGAARMMHAKAMLELARRVKAALGARD